MADYLQIELPKPKKDEYGREYFTDGQLNEIAIRADKASKKHDLSKGKEMKVKRFVKNHKKECSNEKTKI